MGESPVDLYEVLRVGPTASRQEISRAYRRLLRAYHPDTQAPARSTADLRATARDLQAAMNAYAVLSDPVRREAYDRSRAAASVEAGSPPARGRRIPVRINRSSGGTDGAEQVRQAEVRQAEQEWIWYSEGAPDALDLLRALLYRYLR